MKNSFRSGWSLRQRLSLMLFSLVLMLWGLSAAVIYKQAEKESQELFDMAISETASLLLFVSGHELLEAGNAGVVADHYVEQPATYHYLSFQLWDQNGTLRYRSANASQTPLAPLNKTGFGWQNNAGEVTRTFNLPDAQGAMRIIVSEPLKHRQEISSQFFWGLFLFSLLLLPLAYFGVRLIVARALTPVNHCVDQVNTLDTQNLRGVELDNVPQEIEPLVQALNSAISRIQDGVSREKRFTADAAHELRTPLAGIKANIQLLQKYLSPDQPQEHEVMLDTLEGVDRCTRMINQLLAMSRSDAMRGDPSAAGSIDLLKIIMDVFELEKMHAKSRAVKLSWLFDPNSEVELAEFAFVHLTGYSTAMELLIRNLVNNGIVYQPTGGEVQVRLSCQHTAHPNRVKVRVSVLDRGPGIPESQRERIFDRFYRATPGQANGSGLGLSICREVAELHKTTLRVSDGLDGQGAGFVFELEGHLHRLFENNQKFTEHTQ